MTVDAARRKFTVSVLKSRGSVESTSRTPHAAPSIRTGTLARATIPCSLSTGESFRSWVSDASAITTGSPVWNARPGGDLTSAGKRAFPTTPGFHPVPATMSRSPRSGRYRMIFTWSISTARATCTTVCWRKLSNSIVWVASFPRSTAMRMWRRSFSVGSGAVTFFAMLQELSKGELVPRWGIIASVSHPAIRRDLACVAVRPLFGLGALDEAIRSRLGNLADELRLHRLDELIALAHRNHEGSRPPDDEVAVVKVEMVDVPIAAALEHDRQAI